MRLGVACVLVCSGCDALFSLTTVAPPTPPTPPADAAIDGAPVEVTGSLTQQRLVNDSGLKPAITPEPASDTPRVRVGNTPVEVTWEPTTGAFSFHSESGALAQVLVGDVEFQTRAQTLALDGIVLGRAGASAIAPSDRMDFDITMPSVPAGFLTVSTTGLWSSTVPPSPSANKFPLVWSEANWSPGQPPARIDGTRLDRMYVDASETVAGASPYVRVSHRLLYTPTVTGGQMLSTIGLPSLTPDACLEVTAPRGDEHAAFLPAVPFTIEQSDASWSVLEVPRPELDIRWQVALATSTGTANVTAADIHYPGRRLGYTLLLALRARASRTVHETTVTAEVISYVPATETTACTAITIAAGTAPLPAEPTLDGMALTDDIVVDLPSTRDPILTWSLARGAAEEYSVDLVELEAGQKPRVVRTFRTRESAIVVDGSLFVPGLTYYFSISAIVRAAPSTEGDFTHQSRPSTIGTMPSPPFKIRSAG